jgi:hypothetical protein
MEAVFAGEQELNGLIPLYKMRPRAGLPDFSWHNIPKRDKIYQMTIKYTK